MCSCSFTKGSAYSLSVIERQYEYFMVLMLLRIGDIESISTTDYAVYSKRACEMNILSIRT